MTEPTKLPRRSDRANAVAQRKRKRDGLPLYTRNPSDFGTLKSIIKLIHI